MRKKSILLPVLLALFLAAGPAGGEDLGPEVSDLWVNAYEEKMSRTLDDADEAAANGEWRKATSLYQEATDRATNQVRRVGSRTYLGIREYVKSRLASWPAEGLAVYREIVDGRVLGAVEDALETGRTEPLVTVARRYPLSTHGARAMLLLGTRAVARGDTESALRHLLEILRIYPDGPIPEVRRADVIARAAVAGAKRGDSELLAEMRARAERLPEGTTIAVGGVELPLRDFLRDLQTVRAGASSPAGWSTVGGSPSRTGGRDGPENPLVPYWTFPIPRSEPYREEITPRRGSRLLPIHPLITEDEVIAAAQLLVHGLPLPRPGEIPLRSQVKPRWTFPSYWEPEDSILMNSAEGQMPVFPTRAGPLLAMAFPDPGMNPGDVGFGWGVERAALLTISLPREGMLLDQRGGLDPRFPDRYGDYTFSGAPVVVGDRLWISGTRSGNRVETLCFAFDLGSGPGILRPLWETSICTGHASAPDWYSGGFEERMDASSVALRNGIVFLCSNTGAVAALDGETGEILWVHKYERLEQPPVEFFARPTKKLETWFPNPPVLDQRYLYVAPVDSDALFVYFQRPDLATGYVSHGRFSRKDVGLGFEPRYLLGAQDGIVFLAGETRNRAERPLFAVKAGPAFFRTEDSPGDPNRIVWRAEIEEDAPRGRGVVAGDAIYFPTEKGIYRVATADGSVVKLVDPADDAVMERSAGRPVVGNLAVAGPWLVSATEELVTLFGPAPQKEKQETGD